MIHSVPSYKKRSYKKRLVDIVEVKKRELVEIQESVKEALQNRYPVLKRPDSKREFSKGGLQLPLTSFFYRVLPWDNITKRYLFIIKTARKWRLKWFAKRSQYELKFKSTFNLLLAIN